MGKMGIVAEKETSASERQLEKQDAPDTQDDRTAEKGKAAGQQQGSIDPETVRATRTDPCEDPSPTEPIRSANASAYDEDARNFR